MPGRPCLRGRLSLAMNCSSRIAKSLIRLPIPIAQVEQAALEDAQASYAWFANTRTGAEEHNRPRPRIGPLPAARPRRRTNARRRLGRFFQFRRRGARQWVGTWFRKWLWSGRGTGAMAGGNSGGVPGGGSGGYPGGNGVHGGATGSPNGLAGRTRRWHRSWKWQRDWHRRRHRHWHWDRSG